MSKHGEIKDGGARHIGDVLRSAGFGGLMQKARARRKQDILDRYSSGKMTREQATEEIDRQGLKHD